MSVVHNKSRAELILRKKSNTVYYYAVHGGESLLGHIPSKENAADLMTKVLYGQKRWYLVSKIYFMIFMMTIYYQWPVSIGLQQGIYSIGNSIKFEGIGKMQPLFKPEYLLRKKVLKPKEMMIWFV